MDLKRFYIKELIEALNLSVNSLKTKHEKEPWFDGIWLGEALTEVYGCALVIFQKYMANTVYELNQYVENLNKKKHQIYNEDWLLIQGNSITRCTLIHSLANYWKHLEDEEPLNKYTKHHMNAISLMEEEFPICSGINFLNEEGNLVNIMYDLFEWKLELGKNSFLTQF